MSIRIAPAGASKEQSLRLIKHKIKRGQNATGDPDNERDEETSESNRYELISPQPPTQPRNDEGGRSIPRHHDTMQQKGLPEVNTSSAFKKTSQHQRTGSSELTQPSRSSHPDSTDAPSGTFPARTAAPMLESTEPPFDMSQFEVGLDNLGNTCFMNSILQCLLHVEPLVLFFLRPNLESYLNLASPKKGALAVSFRQLVHDVYKKRAAASVSPVNIQRAVSAHAPYLMDYQQQDSQEFLRFLLDGMSEDLCRKHSELAPATAVSASISNASASVTSPASVRQSSILPILPGTPLGGGAAPDFSRTAPAGSVELDLQVKHILVSNSASTSPMTVNARAHPSASQRLREETRAMRQEGLAIDVPTSATAQLPRLRNNNQGEEGALSAATPANAANSNTESHSKYVSRMRNRSEQGREDTATPVSVRKDISSDRIAPFSPILASGEKASKADALMRSADDYEDFSGGEDSSPAASPSKDKTTVFESSECDAAETDYRHRRLRKAPTRRRSGVDADAANAAASGLDALQLAKSPVGDPPSSSSVAEKEAALAWSKYLKLNDSVITDIFAGQLQSTIECLTCHHRSSTYDPFLDLSVPIYRDSDAAPARSSFLGTIRSTVSAAASGGSSDANKSTLEKCLEKFTAEEILDGENMYMCEKCKTKRKSAKQLSIYKYPQVLVIHIKRFKYSSTRREKLSTDVLFPLTGLDLSPYVSPDLPAAPGSSADAHAAPTNSANQRGAQSNQLEVPDAPGGPAATAPRGSPEETRPLPRYDLLGVSNHHGSLHSGHYIAHVDSSGGRADRARRWMCFNDSRVSAANASSIAGPTAYVLFYRLQQS